MFIHYIYEFKYGCVYATVAVLDGCDIDCFAPEA